MVAWRLGLALTIPQMLQALFLKKIKLKGEIRKTAHLHLNKHNLVYYLPENVESDLNEGGELGFLFSGQGSGVDGGEGAGSQRAIAVGSWGLSVEIGAKDVHCWLGGWQGREISIQAGVSDVAGP